MELNRIKMISSSSWIDAFSFSDFYRFCIDSDGHGIHMIPIGVYMLLGFTLW